MQITGFLHRVVKLAPGLHRPLIERASGDGQLHAFGRAHEQLQLQFVFQAADSLGQRGLADADAVRGAAHVPQAGNGQEIVQIFQSHDSARLSRSKKR
ncbi:hypothetical protein D9M71_789070 [compost metagenome]